MRIVFFPGFVPGHDAHLPGPKPEAGSQKNGQRGIGPAIHGLGPKPHPEPVLGQAGEDVPGPARRHGPPAASRRPGRPGPQKPGAAGCPRQRPHGAASAAPIPTALPGPTQRPMVPAASARRRSTSSRRLPSRLWEIFRSVRSVLTQVTAMTYDPGALSATPPRYDFRQASAHPSSRPRYMIPRAAQARQGSGPAQTQQGGHQEPLQKTARLKSPTMGERSKPPIVRKGNHRRTR